MCFSFTHIISHSNPVASSFGFAHQKPNDNALFKSHFITKHFAHNISDAVPRGLRYLLLRDIGRQWKVLLCSRLRRVCDFENPM
jgi:hypothetical protein